MDLNDSKRPLDGIRLLLVCAHPDDECFAFGGMLADAADRGAETTVLCFTDGRAATHRGTASSPEELGQMRRAEFAASCKVLGVAHHEILSTPERPFEDAHLEFADFSATAGLLVQRIRTVQPHVVITFPGDGSLNTHADHMMVSYLTTAAFHWSGFARRYPEFGDPWKPQRLYYQSTNFFMPDRQPPMPMPWSVRLDVEKWMERKRAAFQKHTTQAPLMERTKDLFVEHGQYEFYTLAAAAEPQAVAVVGDLFQGVER